MNKKNETDLEIAMRLNMVRNEVKTAYADCAENPVQEAYGIRKLNFRASYSVSRNEAVEIMKEAVHGGYNEFAFNLIKLLPEKARITIAREGSVCLYVFLEGSKFPRNARMKYDEFYFNPQTQETRIWWD